MSLLANTIGKTEENDRAPEELDLQCMLRGDNASSPLHVFSMGGNGALSDSYISDYV